MPKRRIAMITPEWPAGGDSHGHAFHELALELAPLCDLRVFCLLPEYPKLRLLQPRTFDAARRGEPPAGVDVSFVTFRALPYLTRFLNVGAAARALEPRFRWWRPDLVLAFYLYPQGCAAARVARRLGAPFVLGARGSDLRRLPGARAHAQVSAALRQASAVTAVSQELVDRAIRMGAHPGRAQAIRSAFRSEVFAPRDRAGARRGLSVEQDSELVLFAGRMVQLKGVHDLLHAFAGLAGARPRLRLVCAGSGPKRSEWEALARGLGLADRVTFLGAVPPAAVSDWLAAADLMCLPSYSEGLPQVLIEAAASGRPAVATNVGGIPEIVGRHSGLLVEPGRPRDLAAAIGAALDREWKPGEIAAAYRRSWSDVARETFDLCMRCFASPTAEA